uniref:ATP synthase subunit a n=1 Tax=Chamberlainia hainesiana TaxID=1264661 RepID=A0A513X098_9BIVA|nr:ATP synthase F0 subunit 6 [Chamberlainia hainesiana]QDH07350.1 ATP synthase F0 subunit 6 [Chamberlainia hainesiana]
MLVDIFSSLDASVYSSFSVSWLVWLSGFGALLVCLVPVWAGGSGVSVVLFSVFELVLDLVKHCFGSSIGGFPLGQVSLFLLIFAVNIFGMVPNIFGCTSQLSVTIVLSTVVWFCLVFSGWCYSWENSAGHLVPVGSPAWLIPLLVLIESVSVLIRPITLGVRLAANITMGHLMLHVIGEYVAGFFYGVSIVGSLVGSVIVSGYVIFEFVVSFLQAYVFVLLVGLYSSDHPWHSKH